VSIYLAASANFVDVHAGQAGTGWNTRTLLSLFDQNAETQKSNHHNFFKIVEHVAMYATNDKVDSIRLIRMDKQGRVKVYIHLLAKNKRPIAATY
jgi:hypothetical protein